MARRMVLAAVLAAALLVSATAAGDPGADKARVDARIGDLRARAGQAASKEGLLTTELSALTSRSRNAQAAVATEQAKLDVLESQLVHERARLAAIVQEIAAQTARLVVLEREYAIALRLLERRVREIYETESPDVLSVALGTSSFAELLDSVELVNRIGRQNQRLVTSFERSRVALARTRAATERARSGAAQSEAAIEVRTAAQRSAHDRVAASRDAFAAAEQGKASALASMREDRASFVAEAEGLAAESAALAQRIVEAQQAAAASSTTVGPTAPVSSTGGLGWPAAGAVTSGFGLRWGRMHDGIDIGVGTGTPVHAAAAGTVVYAGWMSGYGNIVVIDHGNGLSTAYGHNSSLTVAQGATVDKGFVVALSGNTGHSTGPHIHFEVRVNGAPVDPLGYL